MKKKLICLSLATATLGIGMMMSSCKKSEPAAEEQMVTPVQTTVESQPTTPAETTPAEQKK